MNRQKKVKKSSLDYFNDWVIFLFVILLPTQLGKHFFFAFSYISGVRVDYLSPTLYLTDIVAFILIAVNIKIISKTLYSKKVLSVFCILILNILFSLSPPISLYWFLKLFELVAMLIILTRKKIDGKKILIGLVIGAIFTFVLSMLQYVNKHAIQGVFYFFGERALSLSTPGVAKASLRGVEFLRPYGTFSHPNSMAGFYLLVYFFVLTYKPFNRFSSLKNIMLLLSSLLIFFSFSKVAIVAFLFLNILYLFASGLKSTCRPCIVARLITLSILSFIFVQIKTDPLTVQKRYELMKNALDIIIRYPITGTGIGAYLFAQRMYASRFFLFFNQPVHNIFLLYGAQLGIILGGVLFMVVFKPMKRFIFRYPYIALAILVTGFFDHYWFTLQQNMLLLAVVGGMLGLSQD